jgi:hypothetical protein
VPLHSQAIDSCARRKRRRQAGLRATAFSPRSLDGQCQNGILGNRALAAWETCPCSVCHNTWNSEENAMLSSRARSFAMTQGLGSSPCCASCQAHPIHQQTFDAPHLVARPRQLFQVLPRQVWFVQVLYLLGVRSPSMIIRRLAVSITRSTISRGLARYEGIAVPELQRRRVKLKNRAPPWATARGIRLGEDNRLPEWGMTSPAVAHSLERLEAPGATGLLPVLWWVRDGRPDCRVP